jgi:phospholipid-binding lipoprotein MlaA
MKHYKIVLLSAIFLLGCQRGPNPIDPYEEYNRQVFSFNEKVDENFFTPISSAYQTVIPSPFRAAINNFYMNITEISYTANALLQGQWYDAYTSSMRLAVNSTFGVGGLFEMAQPLGLERKRHDFGETLYYYGYKESAYYVVPLFGPATIRDVSGVYIDKLLFNPISYLNSFTIQSALFMGDIVDTKTHVQEYLKNFL